MEIKRVQLIEYGAFTSLEQCSKLLGITKNELLVYLEQASRRISETIRVNQPIEFNRDNFRFVGVAGLIRLAPLIELEIRPKFLSSNEDSHWREDFFTIATLTRFGRIFPEESLRADTDAKGDLTDLIARAIISLYDKNRRRPLRTYQKRLWKDINLDGEIEPETVLLPDNDGFTQTGILLDRQNRYNKIIHQAIEMVLTEVKDPDIRRKLAKRFINLGPQNIQQRESKNKKLPHRHKRWQELYDLSIQVLDGFGVAYDEKLAAGLPGYIINTQNAWESLIFNAVLFGLKNRKVKKISHKFGEKQTPQYRESRTTTPDITIENIGNQFPVDAKYKSRVTADGKEILTIQAADVYESLAFMEALNSKIAVLIYPTPGSVSCNSETGATAVFEKITINKRVITGLIVEPRGISARNGFRSFSESLSKTLISFGI